MYITFAYSSHEMPNGALVISFYIIVVFTLTPPPPLLPETLDDPIQVVGGRWPDVEPPLFDRFANFQIPEGLEIDLDDFIFNPDIDGILQIEPDIIPVPVPVVDNPADVVSRGVPPLTRTLELIEDTGAGRAVGNPSVGELNYLAQFGSDSDNASGSSSN